MSDGVKSEISSDIDPNYALNTADPKDAQELIIVVSNFLNPNIRSHHFL